MKIKVGDKVRHIRKPGKFKIVFIDDSELYVRQLGNWKYFMFNSYMTKKL